MFSSENDKNNNRKKPGESAVHGLVFFQQISHPGTEKFPVKGGHLKINWKLCLVSFFCYCFVHLKTYTQNDNTLFCYYFCHFHSKTYEKWHFFGSLIFCSIGRVSGGMRGAEKNFRICSIRCKKLDARIFSRTNSISVQRCFQTSGSPCISWIRKIF